MANTLTGKILHIYPTQQIPSKDGSKTILKRGIVIAEFNLQMQQNSD